MQERTMSLLWSIYSLPTVGTDFSHCIVFINRESFRCLSFVKCFLSSVKTFSATHASSTTIPIKRYVDTHLVAGSSCLNFLDSSRCVNSAGILCVFGHFWLPCPLSPCFLLLLSASVFSSLPDPLSGSDSEVLSCPLALGARKLLASLLLNDGVLVWSSGIPVSLALPFLLLDDLDSIPLLDHLFCATLCSGSMVFNDRLPEVSGKLIPIDFSDKLQIWFTVDCVTSLSSHFQKFVWLYWPSMAIGSFSLLVWTLSFCTSLTWGGSVSCTTSSWLGLSASICSVASSAGVDALAAAAVAGRATVWTMKRQ